MLFGCMFGAQRTIKHLSSGTFVCRSDLLLAYMAADKAVMPGTDRVLESAVYRITFYITQNRLSADTDTSVVFGICYGYVHSDFF